MKSIRKAIPILVIIAILCIAFPVQAEVLEKDANPIKMVLTQWGGVSLEQQGQERFFKVWNRTDNSFSDLGIAKTNIQSFDVENKILVYIKNLGSYSEVYSYNMDSQQSQRLDNTFTNKKNVRISGNHVVWEDYGGGKANVIYYNLASGELKNITNNNLVDQKYPDVSEQYISWIDSKNGYEVIMVYNLSNADTTLVRDTINDKMSLSIFQDKLVWAELREGSGTGAAPSANQYFEELWGSSSGGNSVYDIWMYDIGSKQIKRVTDSSVNQVQPAIWDNYIAWSEINRGNPDLRLMNINTGQISTIAQTDSYEVQASLAYGYLSWVTLRGHSGDLNVLALSGSSGGVSTQPEEIKVLVNGTRYYTDPLPYIKNDRTMVPMRRVFEILNADVQWNNEERSVTATKGSDIIKLYIGSSTAYKNGEAMKLEAAPEILASAGRTMVPLRFVAEALSCSVDWDPITRSVIINTQI
ncbi:MAG: stalk domain-containing protein [Syntrophomonadaceae bacterium]|jgi:beta propeller repeat protein